MKRILSLLLVGIILFSANSTATYAKEYSGWAKEYIQSAEQLNIIPGDVVNYTDEITRKQYAEILVKLVEKLTKSELGIDDVSFTDTNDIYVLKAYTYGIVNGNGTGQFYPDDNTTREQVAVMFINTINRLQDVYNLFLDDEKLLVATNESNTVTFNDQKLISSWALTSVEKSYANGIISGVGNNNVNPKGNTTVEQALTMAVRVYDKYLDTMTSALLNKEEYETGFTDGKFRAELIFDDYEAALKKIGEENYEFEENENHGIYHVLGDNKFNMAKVEGQRIVAHRLFIHDTTLSILGLSKESSKEDLVELFGVPTRIGVEYPEHAEYSYQYCYIWERTYNEGTLYEHTDIAFRASFTEDDYKQILSFTISKDFYFSYLESVQ